MEGERNADQIVNSTTGEKQKLSLPKTIWYFLTGKLNNDKHGHSQIEIMITTYLVVATFLGMVVYLCYFVATSEQEVLNNSFNSRQEILIAQNYRGDILSDKGDKLATTTLDSEQNETRVYPYGEIFSHVVGFSTHGRTGVEAASNYYLITSSAPITDKVVNDVAGNKNPGDDVYTTLNTHVQETAYKALGVYDGAIIVTEPATGKIIAMVSKPGFDPNTIDADWETLTKDKSSGKLLNRATQGLYPPGSTFKIVTALEYIKENPDTYNNYGFQCNGRFTLGDSTIQCYHGSNHGYVDFKSSFAKSCNSSFANIGTKLNKVAFRKTLDELLFNQELPVKFVYGTSSVHMEESLSDEEIIQTSIGQGKTQITPLHLNMITCAIANNGSLMKPYVVDCVTNSNNSIVKQFKSSNYGKLMSAEEAEILRDMMKSVVTNGTATFLKNADYTSAGKTGSAEYNSKGDSHAWFTGFAPADNPKVCVTIIVEGAGSGGDYAVPMAKRLFDAYFEEYPINEE